MKSETQKVQCQKIDKYFFKNAKGRIFINILNFAEESFAKRNLLTIMKI